MTSGINQKDLAAELEAVKKELAKTQQDMKMKIAKFMQEKRAVAKKADL